MAIPLATDPNDILISGGVVGKSFKALDANIQQGNSLLNNGFPGQSGNPNVPNAPGTLALTGAQVQAGLGAKAAKYQAAINAYNNVMASPAVPATISTTANTPAA